MTQGTLTERSPGPRGAAAQQRPARILVADNDSLVLDSLGCFLREEGYDVTTAASLGEAEDWLVAGQYELVILDVDMPGEGGLSLLRRVRANHPGTAVIMVTAYGTIESAIEAMKQGAYDYLTKPVLEDDVRLAVRRAIQHRRLAEENRRLRQALDDSGQFPTILSQDYRMAQVFEMMSAVAAAPSTVLICGESGTGKSLVARAIHARSPRRGRAFVEVSCGALSETLLASELFGHVRGAFTGAVGDAPGRLAAAEGGTLFLDEIAAASPALQVKLLRVLQERAYEPVGSNVTRRADVRVILATHQDLKEQVRQGRFREDLYYRIHVVTIELPPLRRRAGDIPLLAKHFLETFRPGQEPCGLGFAPEAMERMQRYPWPGNVRELENCIERAAILCRQPWIGLEDLPDSVRTGGDLPPGPTEESVTLAEALERSQRQVLQAALRAHGGNRKATARQLGINRTTLYKKMKRLGIRP